MNDYTIISDTTPILAFIKKNELDILKKLFNRIFIPKAVYDEILNTPEDLGNEARILQDELKKK